MVPQLHPSLSFGWINPQFDSPGALSVIKAGYLPRIFYCGLDSQWQESDTTWFSLYCAFNNATWRSGIFSGSLVWGIKRPVRILKGCSSFAVDDRVMRLLYFPKELALCIVVHIPCNSQSVRNVLEPLVMRSSKDLLRWSLGVAFRLLGPVTHNKHDRMSQTHSIASFHEPVPVFSLCSTLGYNVP